MSRHLPNRVVASAAITALVLTLAAGALCAGGCRPATPPGDGSGGTAPQQPGPAPTVPGPAPAGPESAPVSYERSLEGLAEGLAAGYGLAFTTANRGEDAGYTLYVCTPWSSEPVAIDAQTDDGCTWDPEGKSILYLRQPEGLSGPRVLVLTSLDGTPAKEIPTPDIADTMTLYDPGFSPDGSYITVCDGTSASYALHVLLPSGREVALVIIYTGDHVWSLDSSLLAYESPETVDPPLAIQEGCSGSLCILDLATGEEKTLVKGDRDFMYGPVLWTAPDQLVYVRTSVAKPPDWEIHQDYFSLDPSDPLAVPVAVTRPESLPLAYEDQEARIPADLLESWTGLFEESPEGSVAVFATSLDGYPYHILRVLDLNAGACGVLGPGGAAAWSPVPIGG